MRHRRIELRIDEVVVHGVAVGEPALGEALEGELVRLAAERGLQPARCDAPHLDAGTVHARAGELGVQIARAVWKGLQRGTASEHASVPGTPSGLATVSSHAPSEVPRR